MLYVAHALVSCSLMTEQPTYALLLNCTLNACPRCALRYAESHKRCLLCQDYAGQKIVPLRLFSYAKTLRHTNMQILPNAKQVCTCVKITCILASVKTVIMFYVGS